MRASGQVLQGYSTTTPAKNGLALPLVSTSTRDALLQFASDARGGELSIDLEKRTIAAGKLS